MSRAHDIGVPALVLQGADDKVVPPAQAQLLVDSMRAAARTVDHHVYEGEGHGFALGDDHRRFARTHRRVPRQVGGAAMTDLVTDYAWEGPRKGSDRAVLLAHGAGSDFQGATLRVVADALAAAGVPSLRFNYPYRSAGRKAPDRPKVLDAATREAASELAKRAKLPPGRLVLGGRSMGGRYCSMAVGADDDPLPALGLLMLSYPLHAAGKPEKPRTEHFADIRVPVLFVSGTRDSLAGQDGPHRRGEGHPGDDLVPLDRHRRPRLPAAEGQRTHHRRHARRRWRRASVDWVGRLPV